MSDTPNAVKAATDEEIRYMHCSGHPSSTWELQLFARIRQQQAEIAELQEERLQYKDAFTDQRNKCADLRIALTSIAKHPHCQYPVNGGGEYATGVTDGHRCSAEIAKAALNEKGGGSDGQ